MGRWAGAGDKQVEPVGLESARTASLGHVTRSRGGRWGLDFRGLRGSVGRWLAQAGGHRWAGGQVGR